MATKQQTKTNAKRGAEAATRRSGGEPIIQQADGGWVVVATP